MIEEDLDHQGRGHAEVERGVGKGFDWWCATASGVVHPGKGRKGHAQACFTASSRAAGVQARGNGLC